MLLSAGLVQLLPLGFVIQRSFSSTSDGQVDEVMYTRDERGVLRTGTVGGISVGV
ncbi:MAG: hypothetical protein OXT72_14665 [Gammaproteobacteria bacterium]|nr:hypothetical protein [Gammaproteobacteria bacterium]MDE0249038.1 hypothetical protein [Gammaproteobacteria bacterium]